MWRIAEQIRRPARDHVFAVAYDEFTADRRGPGVVPGPSGGRAPAGDAHSEFWLWIITGRLTACGAAYLVSSGRDAAASPSATSSCQPTSV
jgi:hypothetical protein